MNCNVYDVFYLQFSHQHVSADIAAIFRVMLLLQEYRPQQWPKRFGEEIVNIIHHKH
jgi:hypothetical protein